VNIEPHEDYYLIQLQATPTMDGGIHLPEGGRAPYRHNRGRVTAVGGGADDTLEGENVLFDPAYAHAVGDDAPGMVIVPGKALLASLHDDR